MELPEAPCLRPLMAEHRAEVEIFLRERIGCPVVLDEGADCTGSALGAQGQGGTITVRKGVHLLLDDICRRADAPGKERSELEDGDADLLVPVTECPASRCILDETPSRGFLRKDVFDPFYALDCIHIQRLPRKIRDYSDGLQASQRKPKPVIRRNESSELPLLRERYTTRNVAP